MVAHSYRHSNARTGSRRAHDALKVPIFGQCPRCTQPMLPHRICPNCGFYKGNRIIDLRKA